MAGRLPPIGLLAGWGRFPVTVAESLVRQGREVCVLGIQDHADPALRCLATQYTEVGVGQLGAAIRFFRRHGATTAIMAGKLQKTLLFRRFFWVRHFPDWTCLRTFFPHFILASQDRRDDTLLGAIVGAFARQGVRFLPATDLVPELLVKQGVLTKRQPSAFELGDVHFGWQVAKDLGRLDIGQAVAVKGRTVLALEAIEGTDACIRRAGELCQAGGFTVVKVAKPQQDMRFDVPTIGLGTLDSMIAAGARVLAVEADQTILVDQETFLQYANRHALTVIALRHEQCQSANPSRHEPSSPGNRLAG